MIAFNILLLQVFLLPNKNHFAAGMKSKCTPNLLLLALVFYSRWQSFILPLGSTGISTCDKPILAFASDLNLALVLSRWNTSLGAPKFHFGHPVLSGHCCPLNSFQILQQMFCCTPAVTLCSRARLAAEIGKKGIRKIYRERIYMFSFTRTQDFFYLTRKLQTQTF